MGTVTKINPHSAGTEALGPNSGDELNQVLIARAKARLKQSLALGGAYIMWGCVTTISFGVGVLGLPVTEAAAEAGVIALVLGLPTLGMALRRGVVSAAFLSLAGLYGAAGHIEGVLAGDPHAGIGSAVGHFVFMLGFIRSGWAAFRLRRLQKSR